MPLEAPVRKTFTSLLLFTRGRDELVDHREDALVAARLRGLGVVLAVHVHAWYAIHLVVGAELLGALQLGGDAEGLLHLVVLGDVDAVRLEPFLADTLVGEVL